MKRVSITTGIVLCFLAAFFVTCRAAEVNPDAYSLYSTAFTKNYDYQPAIDAFSKIASETKDKETEFRARYFLTLANFCATRFDEAYKQARACCLLAEQLYPNDKKSIIASRIADMITFDSIRDVIIANSRIKPLQSGTDETKLLDFVETSQILDMFTPLKSMWPTPVYQNARDKIRQVRQKGGVTDNANMVIGMMEKNMAQLKESTIGQFAATCGILALLLEKSGADPVAITNNLNATICCHNLRQIGLAFHMYLLDNNGSFPPLSTKASDSTANIPWMIQLAPYLNAKWVQHSGGPGSDGWYTSSGKLEWHYFLDGTGVFFCPGKTPTPWNGPWVIDWYVTYGYNDMGDFGSGITLCTPVGQKLSNLKYPGQQLVLADTASSSLSGYRLNPRHSGHVNVLYADGHVNAEDVNWLWKADPSGIPWNSNNPYTPRKVSDWSY